MFRIGRFKSGWKPGGFCSRTGPPHGGSGSLWEGVSTVDFYLILHSHSLRVVLVLTAPGEGLHAWLFFIRRNVSVLLGCVSRDQNLRSKPTVLGVIKTATPVFS